MKQYFPSENILLCRKCGSKIQKGYKFCPHCGTKIPEGIEYEINN